jgi:hypothetical protein
MVRFLHGGGVLSKDCFWRIDSNEPAATAASNLQLNRGHPTSESAGGRTLDATSEAKKIAFDHSGKGATSIVFRARSAAVFKLAKPPIAVCTLQPH